MQNGEGLVAGDVGSAICPLWTTTERERERERERKCVCYNTLVHGVCRLVASEERERLTRLRSVWDSGRNVERVYW